MDILRIVCGAYAANAYIIDNEIVIDPGDALEKISAALPRARAALLTHGHFDHILSAGLLDCDVYVSASDAPMLSDAKLSLYDPAACELPAPSITRYSPLPEKLFGFAVIPTPGHTPGSACFYSETEGVLFSGDTLFRAGFGRTDFPGGSMRELRVSLKKLLDLPGDVRVYPGHGDATTIAEERRRYAR